jgi:hypothetical protein
MSAWPKVHPHPSLSPRLSLIVPLLLCSACERPEVRRAHQVMRLVRTMEADLQAVASKAATQFAGRTDFEELRRSYGDERFDGGIPLAPDFQGILTSMIRDLEAQLDKEPKDSEFPRKAARRIRQLSQWWTFIRQNLELRRGQLAQAPSGTDAQRLLGMRERRADILTVLGETIQVVGTLEAATARCARAVEEIVARS